VEPQRYAEKLISEAIERGELEPQAGMGQPLVGLTNDPDWWVRAFLSREQMPERFAEMKASVRSRTRQAIATNELSVARATLAEVNRDIRRWNERADDAFHIEERSELWLISERARRPVD
jgi:hypothetical protein